VVIRDTVDAAESAAESGAAAERAQRPSLFDFARRRDVTLVATR
jgi:hypothetical protein